LNHCATFNILASVVASVSKTQTFGCSQNVSSNMTQIRSLSGIVISFRSPMFEANFAMKMLSFKVANEVLMAQRSFNSVKMFALDFCRF
jgi:hypothetical protein